MSSLKVSIITASYNCDRTIGNTCDSIACQSVKSWEHLVIDGGSDDTTTQVLQSLQDGRRKVFCEPDDGIYDAMNKGVALASGEIIGFLNADDFYDSSKVLSYVLNAFEDPEVSIVYGNLRYVDRVDTTRTVRDWISEPFHKGMFRKGWMPPHPTVYARKEVFEEVGPFDLSFPICADWEWLYRAFEINPFRSRHVDEYFVKMRLGGVSNRSIATVFESNRQAAMAFGKHSTRVPLGFFPGKLIHRLKQFFV